MEKENWMCCCWWADEEYRFSFFFFQMQPSFPTLFLVWIAQVQILLLALLLAVEWEIVKEERGGSNETKKLTGQCQHPTAATTTHQPSNKNSKSWTSAHSMLLLLALPLPPTSSPPDGDGSSSWLLAVLPYALLYIFPYRPDHQYSRSIFCIPRAITPNSKWWGKDCFIRYARAKFSSYFYLIKNIPTTDQKIWILYKTEKDNIFSFHQLINEILKMIRLVMSDDKTCAKILRIFFRDYF